MTAMSLTTSAGIFPTHLDKASTLTGLMTWSVDLSTLETKQRRHMTRDLASAVKNQEENGLIQLLVFFCAFRPIWQRREELHLHLLTSVQLLRPRRSINTPDLLPRIRLLQLSLYAARSATPPQGTGREARQGTPGVGVKQTDGERGPSGWMEAIALTKRLERFHRS